MKLFRRNADLPVAYCLMPWVRNEGRHRFVDCDDPLETDAIRKLKLIVSGDLDVSSFDAEDEFILALRIPCDVEAFNGTTGRSIFVERYKWDVSDPVFLVDEDMFIDHAPITAAGFTKSELLGLANAKHSAVNYIEGYEESAGFKKGHYLGVQAKKKLRDLEKRNFSMIRTSRMRETLYASSRAILSPTSSISAKIKNEVLQDHQYFCLFCGKKSPEVPLEAHHVIPKNIVKKLRLEMILLTCRWNLVAACKGCNIAKSDTLHPEDVKFIRAQIASGKLEKNRKLLPLLDRLAGFPTEK